MTRDDIKRIAMRVLEQSLQSVDVNGYPRADMPRWKLEQIAQDIADRVTRHAM